MPAPLPPGRGGSSLHPWPAPTECVSLPWASAHPLLSVSPVLPHPFQERVQLPEGPQRPPIGSGARQAQGAHTPLLRHPPPPDHHFPHVKERRFALRAIWWNPRDSYSPNPSWAHQPLIRQSPRSRVLSSEDSQRPEAWQRPGQGTWRSRGWWGEVGSQEGRGREIQDGVKLCLPPSSPSSCLCRWGEVATMAWAKEMSTGGRDGRRGLLTANCPLWLRL